MSVFWGFFYLFYPFLELLLPINLWAFSKLFVGFLWVCSLVLSFLQAFLIPSLLQSLFGMIVFRTFLDPFWTLSRPPVYTLHSQSCIEGLLMIRDFCFWVDWAAGPVHKKKLEPDSEQLLRAVFACFGGQNLLIFFEILERPH